MPLLGPTPTSTVALIGSGYGYSLEVLAQDHGITRVVGTEPTAALRNQITQSEDAEIQAAIERVGLSIASGRGAELWARVNVRQGQARCTKSADVLAEDLSSNGSRARLRTALLATGGTAFDVITENILTVLSDSECQTLSTRIRQVTGVARVIHVVSDAWVKVIARTGETVRRDINPGYNSKTVDEWKALLPLDTIVGPHAKELR